MIRGGVFHAPFIICLLAPQKIAVNRGKQSARTPTAYLMVQTNIPSKGLHSLRHTFATNLVNGIKQSAGTVKVLTVKQVADLLGHSTTQVTEMYYVRKDTSRLNGITNDFNL